MLQLGSNLMRILIIICLFVIRSISALSQGCSDAGFCTLSSTMGTEPDSLLKAKSNSLKVGFSYGRADYGITILASYLEYTRKWNDHISTDVKLTGISQRGDAYSSIGFSDIFITANYEWWNGSTATLGVKLPLTDGNDKLNDLALPMDYQTSLGTIDLIAVYGFRIKKLSVVTAFQLPLKQNKNEFVPTSPFAEFPFTSGFVRKPDALIRLSYPVALKNTNWAITPGVLPIFHLGEDANVLTEGDGDLKISGSSGLTLNLTGMVSYQTKKGNRFEFNAGAPVVARQVRPDGLTRKFIATVEYKIRF
jgi:hypothetical protein